MAAAARLPVFGGVVIDHGLPRGGVEPTLDVPRFRSGHLPRGTAGNKKTPHIRHAIGCVRTATLLDALQWAVLSGFALVGERFYGSKRRASFGTPDLSYPDQYLK
jgi:hypothetical protein